MELAAALLGNSHGRHAACLFDVDNMYPVVSKYGLSVIYQATLALFNFRYLMNIEINSGHSFL